MCARLKNSARVPVTYGANWSNFADRAATPDNVTLAEIVFVGFMCDCFIVAAVWYLDNAMPIGPGIAKPLLYPFQVLGHFTFATKRRTMTKLEGV